MLPRQSSECKRYFREARTKSGFGGNYRRCLKLKIAFLLLLCIIIVILIIFIIIFIHRFFLFSGSGSKLKSHFAFNWYSLTPQKRPNEFDVKTFGPTSPPSPFSLQHTSRSQKLWCANSCSAGIFPLSFPVSLSLTLLHNRCDEHKMEQGQCQRENDALCKKGRQRETENEVGSKGIRENTFH